MKIQTVEEFQLNEFFTYFIRYIYNFIRVNLMDNWS